MSSEPLISGVFIVLSAATAGFFSYLASSSATKETNRQNNKRQEEVFEHERREAERSRTFSAKLNAYSRLTTELFATAERFVAVSMRAIPESVNHYEDIAAPVMRHFSPALLVADAETKEKLQATQDVIISETLEMHKLSEAIFNAIKQPAPSAEINKLRVSLQKHAVREESLLANSIREATEALRSELKGD